MAIAPKTIYRFNAAHIKTPMATSTTLEQMTFYFARRHKRPWMAKHILRRNRAGTATWPDLDKSHKATVIKTAWCWHKNRYTDQWRRTESPEITLYTYGQLTFDTGSKNIQWRKDISSISGAKKTGQLHF